MPQITYRFEDRSEFSQWLPQDTEGLNDSSEGPPWDFVPWLREYKERFVATEAGKALVAEHGPVVFAYCSMGRTESKYNLSEYEKVWVSECFDLMGVLRDAEWDDETRKDIVKIITFAFADCRDASPYGLSEIALSMHDGIQRMLKRLADQMGVDISWPRYGHPKNKTPYDQWNQPVRVFPVLLPYNHEPWVDECPKYVPLDVVRPHENAVRERYKHLFPSNPEHTLSILAHQGGLEPRDLYAVVHGMPDPRTSLEPSLEEAVSWIKSVQLKST